VPQHLRDGLNRHSVVMAMCCAGMPQLMRMVMHPANFSMFQLLALANEILGAKHSVELQALQGGTFSRLTF